MWYFSFHSLKVCSHSIYCFYVNCNCFFSLKINVGLLYFYQRIKCLKKKLTAPIRNKYTFCGKNIPNIKSMYKFNNKNARFIRWMHSKLTIKTPHNFWNHQETYGDFTVISGGIEVIWCLFSHLRTHQLEKVIASTYNVENVFAC